MANAIDSYGVGLFGAPGVLAAKKKQEQVQTQALGAQAQQQSLDDKLNSLIENRPGYSSITGTDEYKNLSGLANSQGDLPQYALLKQQAEAAAAAGNTKLAQQLNDELQNQAISGAGAQTNAYSALAEGGGLSSGARERIASTGADNQLFAAQKARLENNRGVNDINTNLQTGLLDLGAKSAAEKMGLQSSLLGTRAADLGGQNALTQSQYNQGIDIAAARAKAQKEQDAADEAAKSKGGGPSIICTKMHSMGFLPDDIYEADEDFGRWLIRTHPVVMFGYLAWAKYVVALINKLPFIAYLIAPAIQTWANEMAYCQTGRIGKPSFVGKLIMSTGWAFSKFVGQFVYTKKRRSYGLV